MVVKTPWAVGHDRGGAPMASVGRGCYYAHVAALISQEQ